MTQPTHFWQKTLLSSIAILALGPLSQASALGKKSSFSPTGQTEYLQIEDRVFQPVMPGLEVTQIIGDFTSGAHGTIVRLAPGTALPLHYYTEALGGVVISGQVAQPIPGKPETTTALEAGDTFSFAKKEPHETINTGETPALFFIFQDHPWVFELSEN